MALADQAARAHAFHEFENARPRAASFTFLSRGILTLCAISCAMLVTGCARNAAQPLADAKVDAVLAAIARLETLPDARELMTPFTR